MQSEEDDGKSRPEGHSISHSPQDVHASVFFSREKKLNLFVGERSPPMGQRCLQQNL